GRIPWPVCRAGKWLVPVVYRGLAKAVRRESAQAVAYWWGVHRQTVWAWRKALGVGATTEGTARLRSDYTREPWALRGRRKGAAHRRGGKDGGTEGRQAGAGPRGGGGGPRRRGQASG